MPVIQRKGAQSSQGFGEFARSSSTAANYIEDYFSTYLYTGNGTTQTISNGIALADTAAWSSYKLQQNSSQGNAITTDSSGNFYVTGYANDGTNNYILIAKYSSSGVIQWQRKLQQNGSIGRGITTDSSGNVYVTGNANDGSNYIFVAKYNSSGTIQWQRKLQEGSSYGYGITTDSSGNVYVTGQANDGTNYCIVAKYDSSGTIQWQRKLKQNASYGQGITTDTSGNVYVVGRANDGTNDYIIVAKYNSSGTIQWQRKLKQNNSYGYGITADTSGNVYVTGDASDGNGYIIVAKYNSSGTIQWQRKLREGSSLGNAITVDSSGNVYVTGYAYDGTNYIIAAKYDSSGTIQWQRKLKQSVSVGRGITTDISGNVYVAGQADDGTNYYIVTSKLKQDGTATSGTAFVTMVPGTATDSAGTATDSAGTATESAAGATDSAGTATDSAGTATATSATQAAVTGGGGLVWIKNRGTAATNHRIFDTSRGVGNSIFSNLTDAQDFSTSSLTSFNASGFSLSGFDAAINDTNLSYASWTLRKQAKFFDIVTYTGNGANRTISHNLGSVPGCIIIKRLNLAAAWAVYHRSLANTEYLVLNTTAAKATGATYWNSTTPTSTVFSLGTSTDVNANGGTYVAYLFAHDAGGFGSAGTDNVISCGSVTTSGQTTVNLGYEPQFVIIKSSSVINGWHVVDNMRGWKATGGFSELFPNSTTTESAAANNTLNLTSTGFNFNPTTGGWNGNGTYVYIAIRRGPMKTPTSGTSVFSPILSSAAAGTTLTTNFPVDLQMYGIIAGDAANITTSDRLRGVSTTSTAGGNFLVTSNTNAETGGSYTRQWGNTGFVMPVAIGSQSGIFWNFQRAPGFFDEVCYTGTGANPQVTNHNLNVVPELVISKVRSNADDWIVGYNFGSSTYNRITLNSTGAAISTSYGAGNMFGAAPTATTLSWDAQNTSTRTYVTYLFATVAGVSKVGSYTGTGALQTVNCGFTSGARFVLIKRTDSTGAWYVWDSARGISSGNDPYLLLNSTAAEVTGTNYVDTDTTGFKVTAAAPAGINANGGNFIFLAVA